MEYRHLGRSGLELSVLSFGSWVTFGRQLDLDYAKAMMKIAFDAGVNFFDNAETYANGLSELVMGEALRLFRREEIVVSTKIFWGGDAPNQTGLSRKHLIEGTKNALRRMQLDYVDLVYCHRPDPNTPIAETVLAMDHVVRSGYALYWGTSEWSREQLLEAYRFALKWRCMLPSMEQPQYNLLEPYKVEEEFAPLYEEYGLGITSWSPLASGLLTGKYNQEIPEESRLNFLGWLRKSLTQKGKLNPEYIEKYVALGKIADELGCTQAQLAIAWCVQNPHVSSVILGASSAKQLQENLGAMEVKALLTDTIMQRIKAVF